MLSVTILGSTAAWGRLKGPDYHSDLFDAQGELDPREPRETAAFKQLVAQTVKARPADAYAYKMAATAAARSGDPTELRWLNQALRQSPTDGATHLLAAGALARRNQRDQALMQLRLAVEHAPRLKVDAAKRAIQWTQDHAALMRSVPSGTEGVPVLEELTRLTKGVLRNRLATESLRRRETDVAHVALGAALLDAAQQGRAPCDERRDRCLDTANHHSKRAMSLKPNSPSALRLRVRIIEEREGVAAVEPYLRKQCKELVTSRQCESLRLDYGFRLGVKTATAAATDALSSACMEAVTDCARVAENLRARAAKLGYHHLAFTYAWRAALSAPNAFTWASAAGAALRAERPERALQAARRARVFGSDDPEWKKRIMSIEKRAMLQTYVRD